MFCSWFMESMSTRVLKSRNIAYVFNVIDHAAVSSVLRRRPVRWTPICKFLVEFFSWTVFFSATDQTAVWGSSILGEHDCKATYWIVFQAFIVCVQRTWPLPGRCVYIIAGSNKFLLSSVAGGSNAFIWSYAASVFVTLARLKKAYSLHMKRELVCVDQPLTANRCMVWKTSCIQAVMTKSFISKTEFVPLRHCRNIANLHMKYANSIYYCQTSGQLETRIVSNLIPPLNGLQK